MLLADPARSLSVRQFDLASTVESGQIFRWQREGDGYRIGHRQEEFTVAQQGSTLRFSGVSPEFVSRFFALDVDYARIRRGLGKDRTLAAAINAYPGLRIIRQDPWECTVSFLCSSFSNIKKIQLNLRRIVDHFGVRGTFPAPGMINDVRRIKRCSTGYRAKYIAQVNRVVSDAYFEELGTLAYPEAKAKLMELPGIGEKVADCICLFGLGKTEAFPVDVWIKRAMEEAYFNGRKTPEKVIRAFAAERWGGFAGYAQQYLYHWRRSR